MTEYTYMVVYRVIMVYGAFYLLPGYIVRAFARAAVSRSGRGDRADMHLCNS